MASSAKRREFDDFLNPHSFKLSELSLAGAFSLEFPIIVTATKDLVHERICVSDQVAVSSR